MPSPQFPCEVSCFLSAQNAARIRSDTSNTAIGHTRNTPARLETVCETRAGRAFHGGGFLCISNGDSTVLSWQPGLRLFLCCHVTLPPSLWEPLGQLVSAMAVLDTMFSSGSTPQAAKPANASKLPVSPIGWSASGQPRSCIEMPQ